MSSEGDILTRLAGEIDELGRRLAVVGDELRAVRGTAVAEREVPVPPESGSQRGEEPRKAEAPSTPPSSPVPPFVPPLQPAYAYPYPLPPQQAYQARPTFGQKLRTEGAGSRVLAWVGGGVTLLGVVLLLVLAVQRGWLGPLPRVVAGAAFGGVLIGIGAWLHRRPAGRTGAFALAATGFAALYLDVVAATSLYDYFPVVVGLAAGLAVAGGGLVLAVRWDSVVLGAGVVVGCAVCAPMITRGFTPELVTFLIMLQLATTPVQLRRSRPAIMLASALPTILASMISSFLHSGQWSNTAAAAGAALTCAALALVVLQRNDDDPAALSVLASAVIPVLVAGLFLHKAQSVPVVAGAAVVLLGIAVVKKGHAGVAAGVAGLIAVLQASVTQFDGAARASVLLAEALLLVLVAVWSTNRAVLAAAFGFGVIGGGIGFFADVTPMLLVQFRPRPAAELAGALSVAVLLMAVSILLPWAAERLGIFREDVAPWLAAGLPGLYGAAGTVLTIALLVEPDRTGFLIGHGLVTVSWTVAALVLLLRGIRVLALRVTGLVLVGAAVLKLVLFDLSALDGLARVATFLGAGLVLLAAGARYARLVASH